MILEGVCVCICVCVWTRRKYALIPCLHTFTFIVLCTYWNTYLFDYSYHCNLTFFGHLLRYSCSCNNVFPSHKIISLNYLWICISNFQANSLPFSNTLYCNSILPELFQFWNLVNKNSFYCMKAPVSHQI